MHDDPRVGYFRRAIRCSSRIWSVGADTVHLCMQELLWMALSAFGWFGSAICTRRPRSSPTSSAPADRPRQPRLRARPDAAAGLDAGDQLVFDLVAADPARLVAAPWRHGLPRSAAQLPPRARGPGGRLRRRGRTSAWRLALPRLADQRQEGAHPRRAAGAVRRSRWEPRSSCSGPGRQRARARGSAAAAAASRLKEHVPGHGGCKQAAALLALGGPAGSRGAERRGARAATP